MAIAQDIKPCMAAGWRAFSGDVLLILSGEDYTAMEFTDYVAAHSEWSALIGAENVTRIDVSDADHTFSSARLRASVEEASIAWLSGLDARLVRSAERTKRPVV